MKELVEVIAKSLVEHPDEVVVTENEKEDAVIIELKVGPSDMGKVIGRQGRIAKAIRTVVKAAASKSSKLKYILLRMMQNVFWIWIMYCWIQAESIEDWISKM